MASAKAILFTANLLRLRSTHALRYCSSSGPSKWHLYSAVCLERAPVITATPADLERRYANMTEQLEFENSLKSDFELRHEEDIVKIAQWKKGELDKDDQETTSTMLAAQDVEDAATDEFGKFQMASRITDADRKNDRQSLNRTLEEYLVLTVKQQLGATTPWVLPQGRWQTGETLKQTAERVLKSTCGDLDVKWFGNAPIGYYTYKYPPTLQNAKENPTLGAKVFFFRADYNSGQVTPSDDVKEYQWVTLKEIKELAKPRYHASLSQFLMRLQSPSPLEDGEKLAQKSVS